MVPAMLATLRRYRRPKPRDAENGEAICMNKVGSFAPLSPLIFFANFSVGEATKYNDNTSSSALVA